MAAKSETGLGGEEGFDEFSGKRRQEIGLCTFEAFTYKELGYALYMTRRFTIEIEYNGHW